MALSPKFTSGNVGQILLLGIQLIEQRFERWARRVVAENGVPTVGWKNVGAKRRHVLNKLAARVGRQSSDGFFNFLQGFHG